MEAATEGVMEAATGGCMPRISRTEVRTEVRMADTALMAMVITAIGS